MHILFKPPGKAFVMEIACNPESVPTTPKSQRIQKNFLRKVPSNIKRLRNKRTRIWNQNPFFQHLWGILKAFGVEELKTKEVRNSKERMMYRDYSFFQRRRTIQGLVSKLWGRLPQFPHWWLLKDIHKVPHLQGKGASILACLVSPPNSQSKQSPHLINISNPHLSWICALL